MPSKAPCYLLTLTSALALASLSSAATEPVSAEQLYPALSAEVLPALSARGSYPVGVSTLTITNPAQLDLNTQSLQDRQLRLEVWYPARQAAALTSYQNQSRSGVPFSIQANASRDSAIDQSSKFPLVVLSHGYTGYRTIMFYLGEHLASHGYIVAAIDHTDSTNAEVDMKKAPFAGFVSTLFNRSRDQQFVLAHLRSSNTFLQPQLDGTKAAVIGYSMGGFGAVNTVGGCYDFSAASTAAFTGSKDEKQINQLQQLLNTCAGGQAPAQMKVDPAWKAAIALAPWGGQHQLFAAPALQQIKVPMLYIAGDQDDISGYDGIRWLFQHSGSKDKYLLTYQQARHNIAPHPAPQATSSNELDLGHYYEPAWSNRTLNEINKHFALAMLDCHVKAVASQCRYLQLPASPTSKDASGKELGFTGFAPRYATGLLWQQGSGGG